jgi:hypothetical protein
MCMVQNAHCHVVSCTIRDHGIGVAVRDNATVVIVTSGLLDNRNSALYAPDEDFEEEQEWDETQELRVDEDPEEEDDGEEEEDKNAKRPRGCLVLAGSWTNTRTWFDRGRPTYLNNYLFEVRVPPPCGTFAPCLRIHALYSN